MKVIFILLGVLSLNSIGNAFMTRPRVCRNCITKSVAASWPTTTTKSKTRSLKMLDYPTIAETTNLVLAEKDWGVLIKGVLFVFTVTGGMIPAAISANKAMFKAMSGRKDAAVGDESDMEKSSIDPTILEAKYRSYVTDSGAAGPELPFSSLLFASDPIPIADVVAVLGRIQTVDTLADWKNLPSTRLPKVSELTSQ